MSAKSEEITHRGVNAWCEIVDDATLPESHVEVRLWYAPRRDGESVPAFTAHTRAAAAPSGSSGTNE